MALRHKYPAYEMLTSTFTLRSLEVKREDQTDAVDAHDVVGPEVVA